jgi:hypothetical protein
MPFVPVWIYLAWTVSIIFIVYTLEDLKWDIASQKNLKG